MGIIPLFNAPGHLTDFNDEQKALWSSQISDLFDQVIVGFPDEWANDGPRSQFFNPLKTATAPDLTTKEISWIGFPKQVKSESSSDEQRWKTADLSREVQDEYCEWSVKRNEQGKITQVYFTCEGPEYWEFLGKTSPEKVLELYRKYINPSIQMDDLFTNGIYQSVNKWNNSNSGAMHLIQRNNTLGAEIELAAGSSVVREINGHVLTEQQRLIKCGKYGNANRNSDPFIGSEVNALTRLGAMVSLLDPVGLYFGDFEPQGWKTPDGTDPKTFWKVLRGTEEFPVRAVYEIPSEQKYAVGDITINGEPIRYGAQIADFVQIKLVGIAQNINPTNIQSLKACRVRKLTPSSTSVSEKKINTEVNTTYKSRYTE